MLSEADLSRKLDRFVEEWNAGSATPGEPTTLLFAKVWGSYSHNCAVEGSDLDFVAIYAASTRDVLGLYPVKEGYEQKVAMGAPHDLEAHEVAKFCRLLLKGGPAMLETLFTERLFYSTGSFEELRKGRSRFLSKRAIRQYVSYAQGQIARFRGNRSLHSKGGEATEKWAYHFARLVEDAERIATGEPPMVWKEGKSRDDLMAIRNGTIAGSEVVADAERRIDALLRREREWRVPDEPDTAWLNDWLVELRRRRS
jgi:uncharacterized protein